MLSAWLPQLWQAPSTGHRSQAQTKGLPAVRLEGCRERGLCLLAPPWLGWPLLIVPGRVGGDEGLKEEEEAAISN